MMTLFRERLLARLFESHVLSQELVAKLVGWKHQGFSTHVGEPIAPEQKQRLGDEAAYLVRNPLSLKKPSWGRMIAKLYQVDPLVCTRSGKRMSVVAFVTDQAAIGRITGPSGPEPPGAGRAAAGPGAGSCPWTTRGGRSGPLTTATHTHLRS